MKLSLEEIRAVTNGAVKVIEENGAFKFFRFTDEQAETYKSRGGYDRVFATAGIKMKFKTDSENLYIKLNTTKNSSRSYFSFDISKDGEIIGYIKNFDEENMPEDYTIINFPLGEFSGSFNLGKNEKLIEIDFPCLVGVEILEISIDDGASIEAVKLPKKLMAYGDSITHGYDALHAGDRYISKLCKALGAEEINKGIGGEMFYPQVAMKKDEFDPDYITIAYGTNDWYLCESYEQIFNNCREFCKGISENYPDSQIFVLAPIWRKEYREDKPTGKFRNLINMIKETTADLKNIAVIDCFDFIPHKSEYFADFRLHPNAKGFEYYANELILKVKEVIEK